MARLRHFTHQFESHPGCGPRLKCCAAQATHATHDQRIHPEAGLDLSATVRGRHGNCGTVHYLVRRQVVDGAVGFSVKTIRIIVAASPGTADDFFARSVAAELKSRYKPRVFVDNRPSAGGLIGNSLVSKAAADGHTLGMVSVKRLVTELLHDATPYRAVADIVGVAHVASITNVLVVTPAILACPKHR